MDVGCRRRLAALHLLRRAVAGGAGSANCSWVVRWLGGWVVGGLNLLYKAEVGKDRYGPAPKDVAGLDVAMDKPLA